MLILPAMVIPVLFNTYPSINQQDLLIKTVVTTKVISETPCWLSFISYRPSVFGNKLLVIYNGLNINTEAKLNLTIKGAYGDVINFKQPIFFNKGLFTGWSTLLTTLTFGYIPID